MLVGELFAPGQVVTRCEFDGRDADIAGTSIARHLTHYTHTQTRIHMQSLGKALEAVVHCLAWTAVERSAALFCPVAAVVAVVLANVGRVPSARSRPRSPRDELKQAMPALDSVPISCMCVRARARA